MAARRVTCDFFLRYQLRKGNEEKRRLLVSVIVQSSSSSFPKHLSKLLGDTGIVSSVTSYHFKSLCAVMMPKFLLLRFVNEKAMHQTPHVVLICLCVLIPFTLASDSLRNRFEKTLDPSVPTMPTLPIDRDILGSFYRRNRPASMRPVKSPRPVSWGQYDACGGNILVPLSNDRNILIEQTYKSTDFPSGRTHPLICSWKVEVSNTNCDRGLVTMTVDELSRLSDEEGCLNGFYRVSPFMKEAKICGRIGTVPPFQWHVDEHPENVTITLKHIGLNDGMSEGLSFTLTGECLPNEVNVTIDGSNGHWLVGNSTGYGVPVVVLSDEDDVSSEITDVNNSVESQEDDSEIPLTTTTPPLPVTLPFNMDYYRSRKSTDRQPSYNPTTSSPNVITRNPSNAKSASTTQKPVTKRPTTTKKPTTRNPSTKNTTKKPAPRSTTARPTTKRSSTRPPSTTSRPATTTKRPTTTVPSRTVRPNRRSSTTKTPAKTTRRTTTTKKPTARVSTTTAKPTTKRSSTRPTTTTPRPVATRRPDVSQDNADDIPWLILNAPSITGGQSFSPDPYKPKPVNTYGNKIAPMAINENGEIPWLILKTPNHNKFMPQVQPVVEPSLVTKRPTVKTTKSPSKNAPKSPPKSSSKSPPKNPSKSPNKSQSKNAAKSPSKSSPSKARQPNTKTKPPPPTTTTASPPVCPQSPACPKCPVQPSESSLPAIRRPIMKHSVSWDQYDTCGGTINVPLSFDRLSSYESLHFPAGRNFPLACTWNVKVRNTNCSRGRITLRVDGRSRLADVKGCTKGYYTVFPFMMQAKICGRIGTAPPLHWYIDDQQPEDVTIVMENIGLDDGRAEGFSFSLQGECIANKPDAKTKLEVAIDNFWSHNRWMSRLLEDFRTGDGPRVAIPGVFGHSASSALPDIEPDEPYESSLSNSGDYNDEFGTRVTSLQQPLITSTPPVIRNHSSSANVYSGATHFTVQSSQIVHPVRPSLNQVISSNPPPPPVIIRQPQTTVRPTTTTRAPVSTMVHSGVPWSNFYDSYDSEAESFYQTPSTTTTTVRPWTQVFPSTSVPPPVTRRPTTSLKPASIKGPVISINSPDIPWVILKSPNSTHQSPSEIYSISNTRLPSTTLRPHVIHTTTRIPSTSTRPVTKRPSPSTQINYTSTGTRTTSTTTTQIPKRPSTTEPSVAVQAGFFNTEWHTDSSSTFVPTVNGGQLRLDTCKGDIMVPLSTNPNVHQEFLTVKSTWFPFNRVTPLICSWNVRVSDNCRRGVITMTIDERSRLADDEDCLRGYYRVAPFMNESKICGRIHTVPAFQWYVDNAHPEDVSIILKHVGLNDGYSEGLSFTLSGECLSDESDLTKSKATKSYNSWMQQLASQSLNLGVPTVVLPDIYQPSGVNPQSKTNPEDLLLAKEDLNAPQTTNAQKYPNPMLTLSSYYQNATSPDPAIFSNASNEDLEDLWLILQSPSSKQSLPNPNEEESNNNVSLEVTKTPNIPVDDVFDDALSYITRLLNETKKIRKPLKKVY